MGLSEAHWNERSERHRRIGAHGERYGAIGFRCNDAPTVELQNELTDLIERDVGGAVAIDVDRARLAARRGGADVDIARHAPKHAGKAVGGDGEAALYRGSGGGVRIAWIDEGAMCAGGHITHRLEIAVPAAD